MAHTNSPVSSTFPRMSKIASVQLALYRTLELSIDDVDACVAPLAGAPHLVPFDPELLADTLPYATFHHLLATPACTRLALPYIPLALRPRSLPVVRIVVGSTLYDGLRPASLFGMLVGALKEFVLVPVRARAAVRRAGKHGHGARAESRNEALRTLRLQVALVTEAAQAEEELVLRISIPAVMIVAFGDTPTRFEQELLPFSFPAVTKTARDGHKFTAFDIVQHYDVCTSRNASFRLLVTYFNVEEKREAPQLLVRA
ncbi:hypothetical protein EDB87DRAFT_1697675 [Lactarius vividus]|nr:hypothetical protein EDB87DRAFT_1697675 [Lactarius vividus]